MEALGQAFRSDAPLPRLTPDEVPVAELEAAAVRADADVAALRSVQERRLDLLEQTDVVDQVTIERLSRRHADAEIEVLALERRAVHARANLEGATAPHPTGVGHERLLDLLRALADTRSPVARQLLRDAFTLTVQHDVIYEPEQVPRHRLEIIGDLAIHDRQHTFTLPVRAVHEGGPAAKVPPRLVAAVTALRDGIPLSTSLGSDWDRCVLVRAALGPTGATSRRPPRRRPAADGPGHGGDAPGTAGCRA